MIIFLKTNIENYLRISFGDFYTPDRIEQVQRLHDLEVQDIQNEIEQKLVFKIVSLLFTTITVLMLFSFVHTHVMKLLVLFI